MILTLNMKDIMLGVLSPIGGGGDWIAAVETRLYFLRNLCTIAHTNKHKPVFEYVREHKMYCRQMRNNSNWDVARCDL